MKRPLAIVGQASTATSLKPLRFRIGETPLQVADTGDGTAAALFGDMLVLAGAELLRDADSSETDLAIILRAPSSTTSQTHAESLEAGADVVLGSPRPAFARLLVEELTPSEVTPV